MTTETSLRQLDAGLRAILQARSHEPFAVLGRHPRGRGVIVRTFLPGAESAWLHGNSGRQAMERIEGTDFFIWEGDAEEVPEHYELEWHDHRGEHRTPDPYAFAPQLGDYDLYLFGEGRHWHAYRFLGAHRVTVDGIAGTRFAVWAPNAERISVVGEFNEWDGRRHPMRVRGESGVWELFIPGLEAGTLYKYEIRNRHTGAIHIKADPYSTRSEQRPATASIVTDSSTFQWRDDDWMASRDRTDWLERPMAIYEVHLGSWMRDEHGGFLNFRALAESLVAYVKDMGYTHVELMPVAEHPLDASWGYQVTGYYAVTSRFGTPDDFRWFVDHCHRNGIGVFLDWVPGHFPKDEHGLAQFDGSALYEHADPRRGEHEEWGTLIFNYGRNEVRNFLFANALYWLEEFHIDGLRVDAVASMLYLDYNREGGDWVPNQYGGRENLEAIEFFREVNVATHERFPGTLIMAEESTSWPMVSMPTYVGGLGFSMKWNMGWMNDTLSYFAKDPIYRHYHHDLLTFGLVYAFTENFVLPLSHDEVVHGKHSLLSRMPGDDWQKFANLRLLHTWQTTHPGKQLLFMGGEFGQWAEWSEAGTLPWEHLQYAPHQGIQRAVRDLNHLYRDQPALYTYDFEDRGFEWVDCHDAAQSVLSFLRKADDEHLLVALNFTPVPRTGYRVGVPAEGFYAEIFNSDAAAYGGSNLGNAGGMASEPVPWMSQPRSLVLTLPPLAGIILRHQGG